MSDVQRLPATPPKLSPEEKSELRRAAYAATRLYPGPVGEVLAMELGRWDEFGYRFGGATLIRSLIRSLLAGLAAQEAS